MTSEAFAKDHHRRRSSQANRTGLTATIVTNAGGDTWNESPLAIKPPWMPCLPKAGASPPGCRGEF